MTRRKGYEDSDDGKEKEEDVLQKSLWSFPSTPKGEMFPPPFVVEEKDNKTIVTVEDVKSSIPVPQRTESEETGESGQTYDMEAAAKKLISVTAPIPVPAFSYPDVKLAEELELKPTLVSSAVLKPKQTCEWCDKIIDGVPVISDGLYFDKDCFRELYLFQAQSLAAPEMPTHSQVAAKGYVDYRSPEFRFEGFVKYLKWGMETWDLDPSTVIWPYLFEKFGLDTESKFWALALYRMTYSTPGAWLLAKRYPWDINLDVAKFKEWFIPNIKTVPFSHDRWRAKYKTPEAIGSYLKLVKPYGSQDAMWKALTPNPDPKKNFDAFWKHIDRIYSFGVVTNFNYCETLHRVMGVNVDATQQFFAELHKPSQGMTYLATGKFDEVAPEILERYALDFYEKVKQRVPQCNFLLFGRVCCLYAGLALGGNKSGRYPSYYLDRNFEEAKKLEATDPDLAKAIWEAREKLFPKHLLAEFGGWQGRREELKSVFRDRGVLVNIDENFS